MSLARFRVIQQIQMADDSRIDVIPQPSGFDGFQYVAEHLAEIDQVDHVSRVSAIIDNDRDQFRHVLFQRVDDFLQDGAAVREIRDQHAGIFLFDRLRNLDERRCENHVAVCGAGANSGGGELGVDSEHDSIDVTEAERRRSQREMFGRLFHCVLGHYDIRHRLPVTG